MKKWVTLVCFGLLAAGCLPQKTEDYSIIRYGAAFDNDIYKLGVTKKILVPKMAEDLRQIRYQVFTCPVASTQCALPGSCKCPQREKIYCNYFESAENQNEFVLSCNVTRWIQAETEFRIFATDREDESGVSVDSSPALSASILGVEEAVEEVPEGGVDVDVDVEVEVEVGDTGEEVENTGFVDDVEHEAIFDPNKGLLDELENPEPIGEENASGGSSDSGWFGCSFYGDDADSRIEFMILLGLVGLVISQSRKVD